MELGLYAGQYDFSERALLPWTRQLRPGTDDTRSTPAQPERQQHIHMKFTRPEKIIIYKFHVHTHKYTVKHTKTLKMSVVAAVVTAGGRQSSEHTQLELCEFLSGDWKVLKVENKCRLVRDELNQQHKCLFGEL